MSRPMLSRRNFLRGASGAAVALPFLPSVAGAQPAPSGKSIVFVMGGNGYRSAPLYPAQALRAAAPQVAPGVRGLKLADIPGEVSPMLRRLSTPSLRARTTLIQGANLLVPSVGNHDLRSALAGYMAEHTPAGYAKESVDVIAARHLYSGNAPRFQLVKIGEGYYAPGHSVVEGTAPSTLSTTNLRSAYDRLFGGATTDPRVARREALKLKLIDDVKGDYTRVRSLVSRADRDQLDAHLQSLTELDTLLRRTAPISCGNPTVDFPAVTEALPSRQHFKAAAQIVAAALRCSACNVFILDGAYTSNEYHATSHAATNANGEIDQFMVYKHSQIDMVANLANELESAGVNPVTGRPYLDDTLIVHLNECGDINSTDAASVYDSVYFTHVHTSTNMQVLTVGNIGGKLRTGYHLDYSRSEATPFNDHKVGVAYNSVLVTLLHALGIDRSLYENGVAGLGDYRGLLSNNITPENHGVATEAARRAPLPFFAV